MSPHPSGITLQMLERHFDKNLKDAARDLGVGMTTLKRTCRHFGIAKWPRRTLKCKREKLQEALETLRSEAEVEMRVRLPRRVCWPTLPRNLETKS